MEDTKGSRLYSSLLCSSTASPLSFAPNYGPNSTRSFAASTPGVVRALAASARSRGLSHLRSALRLTPNSAMAGSRAGAFAIGSASLRSFLSTHRAAGAAAPGAARSGAAAGAAAPGTSASGMFNSPLMQRFMQKYGRVFVAVHFSVYFAFLGGIYTALKNNVDIPAILEKYGIMGALKKKKEEGGGGDAAAAGGAEGGAESDSEGEQGWIEWALGGTKGTAGTLVLAVLCNKAMFLVRTPITLTLTPIVARIVQQYGIRVGKAAEASAGK